MCKLCGTRGNPPPHRPRPHRSSHDPSLHSSSIAKKNQSRLRLFSEATTKSAAMIPVPAAAGKNTRSVTERKEALLTKGVELRRRHDADATGRHMYLFPFLRIHSQLQPDLLCTGGWLRLGGARPAPVGRRSSCYMILPSSLVSFSGMAPE